MDGTSTDNSDWTGASTAAIGKVVTTGEAATDRKPAVAPIHDGSITAGHDGTSRATVVNTIASMPLIVSYMNAHSLCATDKIPANATGGVFSSNFTGNSGS